MKLFLASHNFGKFVDILKDMVGANRRTLIIANARDYREPAEREKIVKESLELFEKNGFEPKALDLREYFARMPEELEEYVHKYNPGLIYCIGGDVFLLATALNISGMDEIIRDRLENDESVYAGYSAGSIVAADDIEVYERDELQVERVPDYYGIEAVTSGLRLISEYIVPHADVSAKSERTKFYQDQLAKIHADQIVLNDADVYIMDGERKEIKRG